LRHHGWIGQFAEHLGQHQLLALHPADIAQFVVAETQEALQFRPLQQLPAGVEIDGQPLAVIHVVKPLGHIHFDAAEGISQALHRIQVQHQVAIHPGIQQAAELLLHHVGSAAAVEGVGLHHPVFLRVDVGVTRHLGQFRAAVLQPHRHHHVGVGTDVISAHHHDAPITHAGWAHQ